MVIFVIILLAAGLSYPYWWACILRYRMVASLRRICAECGFRLRPLRRLWIFVRNRGERYDLLIENRERILAVKLWSAYRRDDSLVITRLGRVYRRRYAPVVLDVRRDAVAAKGEGRAHSVRRTKLLVSPRETREITRVLLIYPSYRAILCSDGKQEKRLVSGDLIFDKRLHTPSSLEGLLRDLGSARREQEQTTEHIQEA